MVDKTGDIFEQLDNIFPSAKAPLYRRLMADEELTYLREGGGIVGFELDTSKSQLLAGFLLIAIQKHTVYAYRSDLDEDYKLVLFPPLDKMFDRTFDMLDLYVSKKLYTSENFIGRTIKSGKLRELSKDLVPPEKDIDISDDVSERMFNELERARSASDTLDVNKPTNAPRGVRTGVVEETPVSHQMNSPRDVSKGTLMDAPTDNLIDDIPPMNAPMNEFDEGGFDDFDEYEGGLGPDYDPFDDEDDPYEEPVMDWRIEELNSSGIDDLAKLGEFVEIKLGVPKSVTTQVLNKALQSEVVVSKKMKSVDLAKMLFEKLFVDGKL